jgi:hypothetical protein
MDNLYKDTTHVVNQDNGTAFSFPFWVEDNKTYWEKWHEDKLFFEEK